jgi:collagen type V/XI/XXIV/XXVII alpha
MPDDAVFVFCNLTNSGETCVFPDVQSTRMPHIPWEKTPESKKREVWFSSFRQGFKVKSNRKVLNCLTSTVDCK